MAIGPVAHLDDVAGGKVEALFTRAEARDFINVDALIASGRYTREDLLTLAATRDAGFDRSVFTQMLTALTIYPTANSPLTASPRPRPLACGNGSPTGNENSAKTVNDISGVALRGALNEPQSRSWTSSIDRSRRTTGQGQ
jgi:hypothetical protein